LVAVKIKAISGNDSVTEKGEVEESDDKTSIEQQKKKKVRFDSSVSCYGLTVSGWIHIPSCNHLYGVEGAGVGEDHFGGAGTSIIIRKVSAARSSCFDF